MIYLGTFLIAIALSAILTVAVIKLAKFWKVYDQPNQERKIHQQNIPLLGGLAIYLTFAAVAVALGFGLDKLFGGYLLVKHLLSLLLGGSIIMLGGFLDDKYRLKPHQQFIWPLIASLVIVAGGIGVSYLRNPFGSAIQLDNWNFKLFEWQENPYKITLWSDLFTIAWLLGMSYTTKFLDGLDGLVAGITGIASLFLFTLSLSSEVNQPETALLLIIFAGASLGFLFFNFNPAKIFLGEGGSIFMGFALGVLAIISGGKVATALLLLGIPILDAAWVISQRLYKGRKVTEADQRHLHFQLLSLGLTVKQTVILLYAITAIFGALALASETTGKVWLLSALVLLMIVIAAVVLKIKKRKTSQ
ncbi:MAG: hypothetical protein ACD_68C00123G0005 [uncultured bacterium]|nr:MAG: hypothetical protein ACD_68C00123G0005 [uncultured bacterium]